MNCSFCGNDRDDVGLLVSGPGVYICGDCIRLSEELRQEYKIRTMWDSALEYAFQELWGTDV